MNCFKYIKFGGVTQDVYGRVVKRNGKVYVEWDDEKPKSHLVGTIENFRIEWHREHSRGRISEVSKEEYLTSLVMES